MRKVQNEAPSATSDTNDYARSQPSLKCNGSDPKNYARSHELAYTASNCYRYSP